MHLRHIDPRSLEWKDAMLDETRQDLRYVFRAMRSAPAFTGVPVR